MRVRNRYKLAMLLVGMVLLAGILYVLVDEAHHELGGGSSIIEDSVSESPATARKNRSSATEHLTQ